MLIFFSSALLVAIITVSKSSAIGTTSLSIANSFEDDNKKIIYSDRMKPLKVKRDPPLVQNPETVELYRKIMPNKSNDFIVRVRIGPKPKRQREKSQRDHKSLLIDTAIEMSWVRNYIPTPTSYTENIPYVTDDVSGVVYLDEFHIGKEIHFFHLFVAADLIPPKYSSIDGKLGLAPLNFILEKKNPHGSSALLDMVKARVPGWFALHLPHKHAQPTFTIGRFEENIRPMRTLNFIPVETGYLWDIKIDQLEVNSKPVVKSFTAIIDTGVAIIQGPIKDVRLFYGEHYLAKQSPSSNQDVIYYSIMWNVRYNIVFRINGVAYRMDSKDLNTGSIETIFGTHEPSDRSRTIGSISGYTSTENSEWILGTTFLRSVYIVFDMVNHRIGLKSLVDPFIKIHDDGVIVIDDD